MLIKRKIEIDMGHRVPNHKSKCRNFHGHRYVIVAGVDDKIITTQGSSDEGMVIDFGDLKEILMHYIDSKFDHGFVMYEKDKYAEVFKVLQKGGLFEHQDIEEWKELDSTDENIQKIIFVPFIPTAENLAKYWFEIIEGPLKERGIKLKLLEVWETPNSVAIYEVE